MNTTEAELLASHFLTSHNEKSEEYYWATGNLSEFRTHYFFELIWLDSKRKRLESPPVASSVCGILIDKATKQTQLCTYGTYAALNNEKTFNQHLVDLIAEFKSTQKNATEIKNIFSLSSEQLLRFHKEIQPIQFSTEDAANEIRKVLTQIVTE